MQLSADISAFKKDNKKLKVSKHVLLSTLLKGGQLRLRWFGSYFKKESHKQLFRQFPSHLIESHIILFRQLFTFSSHLILSHLIKSLIISSNPSHLISSREEKGQGGRKASACGRVTG
jgi:hypothetical protein